MTTFLWVIQKKEPANKFSSERIRKIIAYSLLYRSTENVNSVLFIITLSGKWEKIRRRRNVATMVTLTVISSFNLTQEQLCVPLLWISCSYQVMLNLHSFFEKALILCDLKNLHREWWKKDENCEWEIDFFFCFSRSKLAYQVCIRFFIVNSDWVWPPHRCWPIAVEFKLIVSFFMSFAPVPPLVPSY